MTKLDATGESALSGYQPMFAIGVRLPLYDNRVHDSPGLNRVNESFGVNVPALPLIPRNEDFFDW